MLFGITVTKELRQFHSRSGITHQSQSLTFVWFIGPKDYDPNPICS
jgi:hypothetical protein